MNMKKQITYLLHMPRMKRGSFDSVTIWYVDVIATIVVHMDNISATVYVDNGTGKSRNSCKSIHVVSPDKCHAAIGIHTFSGNDYLSSFFRKDEKTFWKVACKNANFLSAFTSLGTTHEVSSDLEDQIESYVFALYRKSKLGKVNEA